MNKTEVLIHPVRLSILHLCAYTKKLPQVRLYLHYQPFQRHPFIIILDYLSRIRL